MSESLQAPIDEPHSMRHQAILDAVIADPPPCPTCGEPLEYAHYATEAEVHFVCPAVKALHCRGVPTADGQPRDPIVRMSFEELDHGR